MDSDECTLHEVALVLAIAAVPAHFTIFNFHGQQADSLDSAVRTVERVKNITPIKYDGGFAVFSGMNQARYFLVAVE